jgi:dipeptidyl aminopeptidase/acylaminoacyl peptidase
LRRRSFIAALSGSALAAPVVVPSKATLAENTEDQASSTEGSASAIAAGLQPPAADYGRSLDLRDHWMYLTENVADPGEWLRKSSRYSYRKTVPGGFQFMIFDVATQQKSPVFDQDRLAEGLSKATGELYTGLRLPFAVVQPIEDGKELEFSWEEGVVWRCRLSDYVCTRQSRGQGHQPRGFGVVRDLKVPANNQPKRSPDSKWEAFVQNYNVVLRPVGGTAVIWLGADGSEGDFYDPESISWSPDSQKLVVYRVRPGYRREVYSVISSPKDQVQPKLQTQLYPKPGDEADYNRPVLFHVSPSRQIMIDETLWPDPYEMTQFEWRDDSRTVTFNYTRRGNQVTRLVEIDADSGASRALATEEFKTFVFGDRRFHHSVKGGSNEVIWLSERDGWSHIYLIDGRTGRARQVTRGEWVVRSVAKVDDDKRQIYFAAGGMQPGKDPYFQHYYRIDFDGRNLTPFTTVDAYHDVAFSDDLQLYVDTYSRIDMAPVVELRRTADRSLVATIEEADISKLLAAGFKPPEVLVSKARDGKTEIWGIIVRPRNFDSARRYPLIENIYAGPHGSFVPKTFWPFGYHSGGDKVVGMQALADMGFVVIQCDGMGTANRSKAFHDVCWKNLKDAGFPDRILFHQAVAKRYPQADLTRVGIYGGSAGGQNSLGALLFHPEHYKVAVAYAGCHDNRMDKINWNEQWMGWPVDESYSTSSNTDNAWRLKGQVSLLVGELDMNVDPASTMQVVNALINAGKTFDLLVVPGYGHTAGRSSGPIKYALRRQYGFFLKHLSGVEAPEWNAMTDAKPPPDLPTA